MPLLLWIVSSVGAIQGCFAATDSYYTAAVLEHATFGTTSDSVSDILDTNLAYYDNAMQVAKSKGADIMVFPEYGVFLGHDDRNVMKSFSETIPDPTEVDTTPCVDAAYSQNPILQTLSCMARNNSMFVVANMGDLQKCEGDPDCPPDGDFQYNANVVFDRNGKLLVRYHKENLFNETAFDPGSEYQNTSFETDFGTFVTYISFDIAFEWTMLVARHPKVDGVAFSTKWWNLVPQFSAPNIYQACALMHNVTYLAANIQLPGHHAMGSGIFHSQKGALAYTFNPDGISKLLVSKVPRTYSETFSPDESYTAITETDSWEYVEDGRDIKMYCSEKILGYPYDNYTNFRCFETDTSNYTFVKLTDPSGHLEACNNGMCCTLDYSAEDMNENFYLGVLNETYCNLGIHELCEEICMLVRCLPITGNPCSIFPFITDTVFHYVNLTGNFTTDIVYPFVAESKARLTPLSDWTYDLPNNSSEIGQIHYYNQNGGKIIALGLSGRCLEREKHVNVNQKLRSSTP